VTVLLFTFPIGDWQFWVVSACALGAVAYLCRGFLPSRKKRRREKRVTLTIDRKRAEK
jgi:hypothetical protein